MSNQSNSVAQPRPSTAQQAATAQQIFIQWFNRYGHWIYESREAALAMWKTRGIVGLPAYNEVCS